MNSKGANRVSYDAAMQVVDLEGSQEFRSRPGQERQPREQFRALQRMAEIFALPPGKMLQDIADAALELCNADSAGVSVETRDGNGVPVFHWAAASGEYSRFRNALLPRSLLPCRVSLDTMRPQHIRVSRTFFTGLGMAAQAITDGISIPWSVDGVHGTVWVLAHEKTEAFDSVDYQIAQSLADMVRVAIRTQREGNREAPKANAIRAVETVEVATTLTLPVNASRPEKAYFFRLNAPRPAVRLFLASDCEIHEDQLVLLNKKRNLVALIVLEVIEDWCEVNSPFRPLNATPDMDSR